MKYLYIENGQGFFSVSGLETDKQSNGVQGATSGIKKQVV